MGTVVEVSVTCSVCSAFWDIYNGHSASVDICMTLKCKLVFKLPGNCNKMCYFMVILLFDIGIWQRLLDFYFVNDRFNGLCKLFSSMNYFASKDVTQHETMTFLKLHFSWNCWTFSLIIIEVCFQSFSSPMTINMIFQIFLSWELQFCHAMFLVLEIQMIHMIKHSYLFYIVLILLGTQIML